MAFQFSWIKHVGCQCSQSTMIDWKKYIIKGFLVLKNRPFGFSHVSQIIFCVRCAMVGLWAEVSAPMAPMRRLTAALNRCTVQVRITRGRHNWYILAVYHWNRGGSVHPRWWVGFTFKKRKWFALHRWQWDKTQVQPHRHVMQRLHQGRIPGIQVYLNIIREKNIIFSFFSIQMWRWFLHLRPTTLRWTHAVSWWNRWDGLSVEQGD